MESRIWLNIYFSELVHELRLAEQSAVPSRQVWPGTEVPGWSANINLQNVCNSAKFWLSVWREAGCPRDGWVNKVRIHSKRNFTKESHYTVVQLFVLHLRLSLPTRINFGLHCLKKGLM